MGLKIVKQASNWWASKRAGIENSERAVSRPGKKVKGFIVRSSWMAKICNFFNALRDSKYQYQKLTLDNKTVYTSLKSYLSYRKRLELPVKEANASYSSISSMANKDFSENSFTQRSLQRDLVSGTGVDAVPIKKNIQQAKQTLADDFGIRPYKATGRYRPEDFEAVIQQRENLALQNRERMRKAGEAVVNLEYDRSVAYEKHLKKCKKLKSMPLSAESWKWDKDTELEKAKQEAKAADQEHVEQQGLPKLEECFKKCQEQLESLGYMLPKEATGVPEFTNNHLQNGLAGSINDLKEMCRLASSDGTITAKGIIKRHLTQKALVKLVGLHKEKILNDKTERERLATSLKKISSDPFFSQEVDDEALKKFVQLHKEKSLSDTVLDYQKDALQKQREALAEKKEPEKRTATEDFLFWGQVYVALKGQ
jgi:hypothetical protein